MSLSDSQESLLLATILSGEDRKDKARRSSFSWDLAKLYAQGSPVFVEFIRLAKHSTHSGLRLRAYNALTGRRFFDYVVSNKVIARREWCKMTGSPLPEDTFSDSGSQ